MSSTSNSRLYRRLALACWMVSIAAAAGEVAAADEKPHAFEDAIQKFEAHDRETPPPADPILFVGSSSIRFWDVGKSFPDLPVMNRGFGGSKIADSVYFAKRIVIKYKPRLIVFYAGDNDLASGMPAEQVAADFREFVDTVHGALPKTRIVYIGIKPSIARWKLIDAARQANALIAESAKTDPLLTFVSVEAPMLGRDGQPRGELFVADGLHLNAKGYELWTSLVAPVLKRTD